MSYSMVNIPDEEHQARYNFEVYRPEPSTGRLEGTYFQNRDVWRPSLSYKHKLEDIRNQFTPAENFRHSLATRGKHIRLIQRLELRINRKLKKFTWAALKIQSLYRGNVSRAYFKSIREGLFIELLRREARAEADKCFKVKDFEGTIAAVDRLDPPIVQYLTLKIRSQYRLQHYTEAIATSNFALGIESECETAYYIQACCWVAMNHVQAAYDVLKQLMIHVEQPRREAYRLCGYVATRSQPPLFMEAVDSYSTLIKQDAHDFEVLLERACCYNCLQEWRSSIKDLDFILAYYPNYVQALLLRARCYTCIREWKRARDDYRLVLANDPANEAALQGLRDAEDTPSELPMLDKTFIDNES